MNGDMVMHVDCVWITKDKLLPVSQRNDRASYFDKHILLKLLLYFISIFCKLSNDVYNDWHCSCFSCQLGHSSIREVLQNKFYIKRVPHYYM